MCGDSHLPPAPESSDLIAIIHPVHNDRYGPSIQHTALNQPRRGSADSTATSTSTTSSASSSLNTSRSSSPSSTIPVITGISGRLRLSNHSGWTRSEFSTGLDDDLDDSRSTSASSCMSSILLPSAQAGLNVRIHKYGAGDVNPIMHEFGIRLGGDGNREGVKLDLGVGGMGVVGRAVSIVDLEERVLGVGILGRI